MIEASTERNRNEKAKPQFLLTGFTQSAGIRIYAFESRVDARRMDYTVEVNLALIPGYGIRIQDLPLLCRDLLQQLPEGGEDSALIFTEQRMRSHAEELAIRKAETEHKKKRQPHPATPTAGNWGPVDTSGRGDSRI